MLEDLFCFRLCVIRWRNKSLLIQKNKDLVLPALSLYLIIETRNKIGIILKVIKNHSQH